MKDLQKILKSGKKEEEWRTFSEFCVDVAFEKKYWENFESVLILETKINENRKSVSYKYVNYFPIFLFAKMNKHKEFHRKKANQGVLLQRELY